MTFIEEMNADYDCIISDEKDYIESNNFIIYINDFDALIFYRCGLRPDFASDMFVDIYSKILNSDEIHELYNTGIFYIDDNGELFFGEKALIKYYKNIKIDVIKDYRMDQLCDEIFDYTDDSHIINC